MRRGYRLSAGAQADIRELLAYIENRSPAGAQTVEHALRAAFDRLAAMPGIGHRRQDLTTLDLRFMTVEGVLVAYRKEPDEVEIVRVFGPGRDVTALL